MQSELEASVLPKLQRELLVSVKMDLGSNWLPLRGAGDAVSITAGGNGLIVLTQRFKDGNEPCARLNQPECGC